MSNSNKEEKIFIVDWDLPLNEMCTQRFYRETKGVRKQGFASSKSVFLCKDENTAKIVHEKASKCGISTIYQGKKIPT